MDHKSYIEEITCLQDTLHNDKHVFLYHNTTYHIANFFKKHEKTEVTINIAFFLIILLTALDCLLNIKDISK